MEVVEMLKVARVVLAADEIDGRVKFQKIVYLLTKLGFDLAFDDFDIGQYGPYSRALASTLDDLESVKILNEKRKDVGGGRERYDYTVNEKYAELIGERAKVSGAGEIGDNFDNVVKDLARKKREVLEVAATIVFLGQEEDLEGEGLYRELGEIKGHLREHFDKAKELVKGLDLD